MKKALALAALAVLLAVPVTLATSDKVTICHAAGREGTTHYVTLTIGYNAVYGPAGHFYENGTPRAGHEQDYLGPCRSESTPTPTPTPTPSIEETFEFDATCIDRTPTWTFEAVAEGWHEVRYSVDDGEDETVGWNGSVELELDLGDPTVPHFLLMQIDDYDEVRLDVAACFNRPRMTLPPTDTE